uniref:BTB domain-containing protein n=1 Tax=Strongyloides stercoralis TaxID=6248 RepID=A0A0K0E2U6_STRER
MSSEDINTPKMIDDSNDHEIHKIFNDFSSCFNLKTANINDINNSDILCSDNYLSEKISLEEVKRKISNEEKISFEFADSIVFIIEDNTKDLSNDNIICLAKKYASFFQYVIQHFSNANDLCITNGLENVPDSCFLFHIYKNLKSTNIKSIRSFSLEEIVDYAMKYDFLNSNIFDGFERFNEISINLHSCEFLKNLQNIDEHINNFLSYISRDKSVTLNICIEEKEGDDSPITYALKILNLSKTFSLNVKIEDSSDWSKYLKENNYEFNDETTKIKNETISAALFIDGVNDLQTIKIILTSMNKLEKIIFYINESIPKMIYEEYKSLEESKIYLNKLFNYKSNLKYLTNVRISFKRRRYSEDDMDAENLQYLHDYMLDCIISVLPSSISKVLYLMELDFLPLQTFNKISSQFSSLTTLSFLLCYNIPENALFQLPSLKNVVFNGERKVNIPPWIEIVLFLYFDIDFYYPDDIFSDGKKNEHYFNLMNRNFNVSLRCLREKDIFFIAFMNDFNKRMEIADLINIGY